VEALAFMGLIRWGFTHNRRRTIPTLFYSFVVLIIVFSLSSLVNFVFSWQIDIFENTADPMNQYRQLGRFVGTIFMLCALCISIYHQKIEAHLTKS
jgi:hypothetical protein